MKVSVGVITFNQSKFIQKCLDSIIMQRVEFEYEIVVGDDASTDGTQTILLEYRNKYPNLFVLLLNKKNEGISVNYKNVLTRCTGEYIALCEGDDYWINPLKLQIQVDFLDSHRKYGFVGTYNQMLFPDNMIIDDTYDYFQTPLKEGEWELYGDMFEYAKYGPVTRTVSLCFRRAIIQPYIQYTGIGNDLVLQTILAKHSFFAKHRESMCMYRQGGISNDKLSINRKLYYNNWYVQNRLLQKKLFPHECNWDEEELKDRERYLRLCESIKNNCFYKALRYKKQLSSRLYTKKMFSRYLLGPISFLVLKLLIKYKEQYITNNT